MQSVKMKAVKSAIRLADGTYIIRGHHFRLSRVEADRLLKQYPDGTFIEVKKTREKQSGDHTE